MNKKILALAAAAVLLLCTVACADTTTDEPKETLGQPTFDETTAETTVGNGQNNTENTTPDEINPVFVEKSLKVVVLTPGANVRSAPNMITSTIVAQPAENDELTVTGESEQWYRIVYDEEVRYIKKSIVAPASGLEGFTATSDTVVLSTNANIRSYPLVDPYTARISLPAGTKLERVAVGSEWSRVKVTVTEKKGDEEVEVEKEYYIHNSCIEAETTAAKN